MKTKAKAKRPKLPSRARCPKGYRYWAVSESWLDPCQCFSVMETGSQLDQYYWDEGRYFLSPDDAARFARKRRSKEIERYRQSGKRIPRLPPIAFPGRPRK